MQIITLTTDLGIKDSYVATIKGAIYSEISDVKVIDISNTIDPFNIHQAAYVLRSCYEDFPDGTIHIISVDDELTINNEHLVIKSNNHYFIGSDNGLFSLLLNKSIPEKIIQLNLNQKSDCTTFAAKNVFVPAACHLSRGGTMQILGKEIENFKTHKMELNSVFNNNILKGAIIYVDNYGNAISNITKSDFNKYNKNNNFVILFGRENEQITKISNKYKDVLVSEKLALFGENNFLQIAINQGAANKLLGLRLHEIIRIEFL